MSQWWRRFRGRARPRLTGLSGPLGGASWEWTESERDTIRDLLVFLEDRRVLTTPHRGEYTPHVVDSIAQTRRELTETLRQLPERSDTAELVREMRAACGAFLDEMRPPEPKHISPEEFIPALNKLRGVFAEKLGQLIEVFGFEVHGPLRDLAMYGGEWPGPEPLGEGFEADLRRADQSGDARAAYSLGLLLEGRGDLDEAEAAHRRGDERGDGLASGNLGELLERRGDLDGAEAAYRRADERGYVHAAYMLAALLERRGDLDGAEANHRRGDERGDKNASRRLGELLERRDDLDGAEAAYRHASILGDDADRSRLSEFLERRDSN